MSQQLHPIGNTVRFKRVLGTGSAVVFGLSYMVPLTVFTTIGIANVLTEGNVPLAYIVTLIAMIFTAISYGHMVRAFPITGSAYTYSRKAFGGHIGFMTGWALLLDYLLLPMVNYLVIGIYLNAALPAFPAGLFFGIALVLVTGLNIIGIRLLTRVNLALLGFQGIFIVVFLVMAIGAMSGTEVPSIAEVFFNDDANFALVLSGAALLCFSFLGFDAVSTLSEETKNPRKTIPRAILLSTLLGGVLFIVLSAISNMVFPDWASYTNVDSASLDIMSAAGGAFLEVFFTAAYVAGCFASAMASQATVSRILFSMGRDGVLPKRVFGYLHPRFRTPVNATLIVGVIALSGLLLGLTFVATLISFGALVAFTFVNASVIKHYVIDQKRRSARDIVVFGVVPGIGVLLTLWLWTSLSANAFLLGLGWVAIGLIYLAIITGFFRRKPPEMSMSEQAELAESDLESEPARSS